MATTTDHSEIKNMPEAQASPEHGSHSVDKYADARRAKKKASGSGIAPN